MENEVKETKDVKDKKSSNIKDKLIGLLFAAVLIAAVLYLFNQKAASPVISIDGVEFKLKDSVSALVDAGFEIKGGKSLDGRTWNRGYELVKDGKTYALLTLYNKSSEEKPLSECSIGEIDVFYLYEIDSFMINGIAPLTTDADEVREVLKIDEEGSVVSTNLGEVHILFSYLNDKTNVYEEVSLRCDFDQSYK